MEGIINQTQQFGSGVGHEACESGIPALRSGSYSLTQLCNSNGLALIETATGPVCHCKCGYIGDYCETATHVSVPNIVFGLMFSMLLVTTSLAIIMKRRKRLIELSKPTGFEYDLAELASSRFFSPKYTLFWRSVLFFGMFCPVLLTSFVKTSVGETMRAGTFWNYTSFGLYSLLGVILSFRHCRNIKVEQEEREPGLIGLLHTIIHQYLFTSSVFIIFCFWGILFPSAVTEEERTKFLSIVSYFTHGVVLVVVGFEFLSSKIRYKPYHFFFSMTFIGTYIFFHTVYQATREALALDNCPVYPVIDMSEPSFPLRIVLLACTFPIIYSCLYSLHVIKTKFLDSVEERCIERVVKVMSK